MKYSLFFLLIVGGCAAIAVFAGMANAAAESGTLHKRLADAMAREDLEAIRRVVAEAERELGERAGVPEVPDRFEPVPVDARWLTAAEARGGFKRVLPLLEKRRWWKAGLDPSELEHALREPASVVSGCVAACRAGLEGSERALELAREAGDFLVWAQERAGTGVFPFPASRLGTDDKAFEAAERYLKRAEAEGRLDEVVRKGWVVDDSGDGGLQFDNGECGVALLELFELTGDGRYRDAARKSADWAAQRPVVPNWNFNSFSVYLLAEAYRVTGEKAYLDAAMKKALLGVVPGQLTSGAFAGRWIDGHNARPAYHYIMLRSLASLIAVAPEEYPGRDAVRRALVLGLRARNGDFAEKGIANKDKAMEVLVFVARRFAEDEEIVPGSRSDEALDVLGRFVSAEALRAQAPLGPREWGLFLEHVVSRNRRAARRLVPM